MSGQEMKGDMHVFRQSMMQDGCELFKNVEMLTKKIDKVFTLEQKALYAANMVRNSQTSPWSSSWNMFSDGSSSSQELIVTRVRYAT